VSPVHEQAITSYKRFVRAARLALQAPHPTARLAGINAAWREHGAPVLRSIRQGELADYPHEARLLGHLVRAMGEASALAHQR
jgi:hypothetical protein